MVSWLSSLEESVVAAVSLQLPVAPAFTVTVTEPSALAATEATRESLTLHFSSPLPAGTVFPRVFTSLG